MGNYFEYRQMVEWYLAPAKRLGVYSVQFSVRLDLWEALEDDAMEISQMTSSFRGVTGCLCA